MITLQDVAIIPGLYINGPLVIGTCDFDVSLLCQELLGVNPSLVEVRESTILTRWLSH